MNGFLWTTEAGAIDCAFLVFVCGLQLLFGGTDARRISIAMLVEFVLVRAAFFWTADSAVFPLAVTSIYLAALILCIRGTTSHFAKAIVALWAGKMTIVTAYGLASTPAFAVAGDESFAVFTAAVTVVVYLQLFILLFAGPFDGMVLRIRRLAPALSPRNHRGDLGSMESRGEALRYPETTDSGGEARGGILEALRIASDGTRTR